MVSGLLLSSTTITSIDIQAQEGTRPTGSKADPYKKKKK